MENPCLGAKSNSGDCGHQEHLGNKIEARRLLRLIAVRDDFGRVRAGQTELTQPVHQPLDTAGKRIDLEILRIVMAAADAGIDGNVERGNEPAARAYAGDRIDQR
jgi:hypothetical protein